MNDAAIAFALIALLALGWPVALAMWLAKRNECKWLLEGRNRAVAINAQMKGALQDCMDRIHDLTEQLHQASKNDHRDNKGRFAKAG